MQMIPKGIASRLSGCINRKWLVPAAMLIIWLLFTSCRSKTVYIPVETVKAEYTEAIKVDSVYRHDSIFLLQKGDTILLEKYRYLYRYIFVKDSVFINDTVRVPYPVTEYREVNRLKSWQKLLMTVSLVYLLIIGFKKINSLYR